MIVTIGATRVTFPKSFEKWLIPALPAVTSMQIIDVDLSEALAIDNDHVSRNGMAFILPLKQCLISLYLKNGDQEYIKNSIYCYSNFKDLLIASEKEAAENVANLARSVLQNGYPFGDEYIVVARAADRPGPAVLVDGKHRAAILTQHGMARQPCVELKINSRLPLFSWLNSP
ncbi:MAG TPA: hypothetical protein PKZ97_09150 [Azospirillaceae bacterium]|nr:hypothetical protein [Azospirillaceae bacterium]HRQ81273.1 hypothetical protein [Azospirillaceae bacterium]